MTPEERTDEVLKWWHGPPLRTDPSIIRQVLVSQIRAAVQEEREVCAKVADGYHHSKTYDTQAELIANEIRERTNGTE